MPFWISLKTALAATLLTFFSGMLVAWHMVRYKGRFKILLDSLLTLPMVLPPTVAGFFLLIALGKNGPIGKALSLVNTTIIFSWQAAVISAFTVSFPLMYKTCKGAFEQIDTNLVHAARTLGASEKRIFWKIVVPLGWPGILAGSALSFARAVGEFGATLMVAGNIPGKTQTIPMAIFSLAESGEMEKAFLWVAVIMTLSFSVMLLMQYWNIYQKRLNPFVRRADHGTVGGD